MAGALQVVRPIPNVAPGWQALASLLQALWIRSGGGTAPLPGGTAKSPAAFLAVVCSESPNPRKPTAYEQQDAYAAQHFGRAGQFWTWLVEGCAQWPTRAAHPYTGPWNRRTAQAVLLVANTTDPATNYPNAIALSHELANARLLTVRGYGHTALLNRSSCAEEAESRYFLTGALPRSGTVCGQDEPPFPR